VIGSIFIFRDVTEEKKENLAKRNFLSLISHKLRTPLVTITGYGPILLEDESLGNSHRKVIQNISKQGNYLLSLVEKLLHFTLIDEDGFEISKSSGSIMGTAERAAGSLKSYLEEKGAIITFKDELKNIPPVMLDTKKIEAAIKNILENAVKFNNGKDRKIEIGAAASEGFVGIYIKDNGPGIPPEERERIFQKFYQIEESFTGQVEGAGLGLALVKRIIEAHGGKVVLDSIIGSGSTFSLLFPAQ
jgi:signal transduction histidine kinase